MPASQAHQPIQFLPDAETGCWVWQRALTPAGYGQMRVQRRLHAAHRFFYERLVGPIPDGLDLDHLCRNRACVNPDHLEPVTRAENCRRGDGTWLTDDEVAGIRAAKGTIREIAERYGCAHSHVHRLRAGLVRT